MNGPDDCRYCGGTGYMLVTKGDVTSAPIQKKNTCFVCEGDGKARPERPLTNRDYQKRS